MASAAGASGEEQSVEAPAEIVVPAAEETGDQTAPGPEASDDYLDLRIWEWYQCCREELDRFLPRISELLEADVVRRLNDDSLRRCLDLVETELRHIATSIRSLRPAEMRHNHVAYYVRLFISLNSLDEFDRLVTERFLPGGGDYSTAFTCFRRRSSDQINSDQIASAINSDRISRVLTSRIGLYRQVLYDTLDLKPPPPPPPPPQQVNAGGVPLIGIDRLIAKLLEWRPRENTDGTLRVTSIFGPAGVSKTTLAMELYNQLNCQTGGGHRNFHCIIMARMSRGIDGELLLRDILSAIQSSDQPQPDEMWLLIRHVSEHLQDKRYFIIIDDIQTESDWKEIKDAFPKNKLGSQIVITTRYKSVALSCCSSSEELVHELKPLNHIDSQRLLLARASGIADVGLLDSVRPFLNDILVRCEGIPLFIADMADWLKEKVEQQRWQHQQEEIGIYGEQVTLQIERIGQALSSATYDHLPYDLKFLSLYMSAFPQGYIFEMGRLLTKWSFEGMFSRRQNFQMVDAILHFWDLVGANVVTRVPANYEHNFDDEACRWRVNHFMQQFLVAKCEEIGLVVTSGMLNSLACHNNETTVFPRLSIHHPVTNLPSLLQRMDLSQTRSLTVSGSVSGIPLNEFFNLILLDLDGWEKLEDEDLVQICKSKMFFLRYLSIRNTQVRKLPHEIKELQNLMVLDVSYTGVSQIPREIKKLQKLRVLDLSHTKVSELPFEVVEIRSLYKLDLRGTHIRQLPNGIERLNANLSILLIGSIEMIDFNEHTASFVKALGDLDELRVLAITWSSHQCIDEAFCEALRSTIQSLRKLISLTIHCGLGCSMEFLGSVAYPLPSVEKFKVTAGRFVSIPKWFCDLDRLTIVEITVIRLGTEDLTILGNLPKLQCLILVLDFIPREAIVMHTMGFYRLQRLSIECPVPWLTFEVGAMWNLTHLQLKFCAWPARQTNVPSGISNLPSLTEMTLHYDVWHRNAPNVKMTVQAVRKEVDRHRNPVHLFLNTEEVSAQAVDEVTEGAPCVAKAGQDCKACLEVSEDTEGLSKAMANMGQELSVQQDNHQEEIDKSTETPVQSIDSASSSLQEETDGKGMDIVSSDPLLYMSNEVEDDLKGVAKNFVKMVAATIQGKVMNDDPKQKLREKAIAELRKLALTGTEQIKAAAMFIKMPEQMSMMLTLDETLRREFVLNMLSEEERRKRIEDGTR